MHLFTIVFRDITIVHYGIEYEQANSERSEKNGQFRITLRMGEVKRIWFAISGRMTIS